MSYLISGLNIKNIFEYDSAESYEKYDVVDYQLNAGISSYPSYTGLVADTALEFWFYNDFYKDFKTDQNENVTGWLNKALLKNDLIQDSEDLLKRPYIDYDYNYLNFIGGETLTGEISALDYKTIFICFNSPPANNYDYINILQISDVNNVSSESGFLKISGSDTYGSGKIFIDNINRNAPSPLYNTPNIITLIQTTGSSGPYVDIEVRQNGYSLGEYNDVYSGWASGFLGIGNNADNSKSVKYYDIFCFSGTMSNEELGYYEKYLFEKYFNSKQGLYFAKRNVPAGAFNSPITYTGLNYWTKDLNDLFSLNYGSSANFTANLSALNFGDGYKTNISKNINSLNSSFEFVYDGLTDKQAKSLISYFEYTPEFEVKSLYEGFSGVNINLFHPYKKNAELYFLNIDHLTPYNDINKVIIKAESPYASSLNYKGMFVELDEINIRTYSSNLLGFSYHDVVYFDSPSFQDRGYYFYTGNYTPTKLNSINSPTGSNSYFTRDFYFKTNIDYSFDSELRLLKTDYSSSTKEFSKDGLNYNLLEFNAVFDKRSNVEARAILKFLDDKAGFKIFDYVLPQPYNKTISVYCPEWSHVYDFYNNNTITAKFIEFKGELDFNMQFNTKIKFI